MDKTATQDPLNVVVFGAGEWGKNYLRLLSLHPRVGRLRVVEKDVSRREWLATVAPSAETVADAELGWSDEFPCVVIALPASLHFDFLRRAISEKKHILIEKPVVTSLAQLDQIEALLPGFEQVLMVGHVYLYNPAITRLRQLVESGELSRIYFLNLVRTNLGPIRGDVNCLFDLAPHDISNMLYLTDDFPEQVSAVGSAFLSGPHEDVVCANFRFASGLIAAIQVSWLAPKKRRELTLIAEKRMAVFDDVSTVEKLRLYDLGVERGTDYQDFGEFQLVLQGGDVHIPRLPTVEPLRQQVEAFLDAVTNGTKPLADWQHAAAVVRLLAAAESSMNVNGAPIQL